MKRTTMQLLSVSAQTVNAPSVKQDKDPSEEANPEPAVDGAQPANSSLRDLSVGVTIQDQHSKASRSCCVFTRSNREQM
jgi:hypothetical protein